MEPKTSEWRPGPTVCRCCLTEGCYKDISTEYFWMGKREVYSEMLSETFSVSISYSKSGGPNSQSRLICEQCISRLRDAADFKRQVVECEKMFMQHLDPGTSSVVEFSVPQVESSEKVKLERVKVEKVASDDDFDDGGFPDDDDDDDDLDDQPLMKLASKIPKKESLDLRDLLDNTKLVLKRKAPPTSKTKPVVPTKKLKSKKEVKPAPSKAKAVAKPAPKPVEKKKKELGPNLMAKRNAEVVLLNSTAYPFRVKFKSLVCVYCCEEYEDPDALRQHLDEVHEKFNIMTAFAHLGKGREYLKVDCTDLKCRICMESMNSVGDVAKHLIENHLNKETKRINLNFDVGLQPYRLEKDRWYCFLCNKKMPSLIKLCRHTTSHYKQHTCELCGRNYLTSEALKYHIRCRHSGKHACRKCWKNFSSEQEKRDHVKSSKSCWPFRCLDCEERFLSWELKGKHLINVHGQKKTTYSCPECSKVYESRNRFYSHFKLVHTD